MFSLGFEYRVCLFPFAFIEIEGLGAIFLLEPDFASGAGWSGWCAGLGWWVGLVAGGWVRAGWGGAVGWLGRGCGLWAGCGAGSARLDWPTATNALYLFL